MSPPPLVPGSPTKEHARSSAALRIARLAAKSELFFAHFERRARLPFPAHWLSGQPDEATPRFARGVLPEPKYQAFRHDLLVASFHPGHRAQWTAHELCHAAVGFAYRPGASTLFHVLAAWLAELLPVALWYFFDEADLRRCPRHQGAGPLFQTYCESCERSALAGPRAPDRETARRLKDGQRYVERELAAIARSRRNGRPEGTRFATIDLAQDALGYARAHGKRLKAPEMERFVAQFFAPQQGHHASLEALEARVLEVCGSLHEGRAARPWRASRWDYAAQDVGYRLLAVQAASSGEVARELDASIDRLARDRSEVGLARCIRDYRALHAAVGERSPGRRRKLPAAALLFAVGYPLPEGQGCAEQQISEGVRSACPSTWGALGPLRKPVLHAFCLHDAPARTPIGRRFASFLETRGPGPLADLAKLEAAITHVGKREPCDEVLDPSEARGNRLRLAGGVEIVHLDHDVLGLDPSRVRRAPRLAQARALAVLRRDADAVDVLELPSALAEPLLRSEGGGLPRAAFGTDEATLDELILAGVLVPTAYAD